MDVNSKRGPQNNKSEIKKNKTKSNGSSEDSMKKEIDDARERLNGINKAASEGIKESAPTFGLG